MLTIPGPWSSADRPSSSSGALSVPIASCSGCARPGETAGEKGERVRAFRSQMTSAACGFFLVRPVPEVDYEVLALALPAVFDAVMGLYACSTLPELGAVVTYSLIPAILESYVYSQAWLERKEGSFFKIEAPEVMIFLFRGSFLAPHWTSRGRG